MANKKKPNFGGKLLLFVLELCVAVAILFFAARILPKDFTITSFGSRINQSLLIATPAPGDMPESEHTPEPEVTPEPEGTPEPMETFEPAGEPQNTLPPLSTNPADDTIIDSQQNGSDLTGDEQTEFGTGSDLADTNPWDESGDLGLNDQNPVATEEPALVSTARTASITISAAGDCTLGGDTVNGSYARFEKVFDAYGENYFFENVKDIFEADDITVVNLEGALTSATSRKSKEFSFRGAPRFGKILSAGSVEVVSIDNNHSQDYYSQGLADTKKTLEYIGVGYAGLGSTYTTTVDGINIGFLSYRVWDMSVETMTSDIQSLKQDCDLVVVSIHWGEEKKGEASATQIKLGHAAVDAGADLVLGHHPHVVGSIEIYKDKYIVYSLGNFCFGGNSNPADKDTFIFQQTFNFNEGQITDTSIEIIPCSISSVSDTNDYKPTPLAYNEGGKDVMKKIITASQGFESTPDWEAIISKMEGESE